MAKRNKNIFPEKHYCHRAIIVKKQSIYTPTQEITYKDAYSTNHCPQQ